MADKPKKGKGKLVGKKKAVKKAKPSAAPIEQGSGLNVESKPKAPVGFTGTYEHEPRGEYHYPHFDSRPESHQKRQLEKIGNHLKIDRSGVTNASTRSFVHNASMQAMSAKKPISVGKKGEKVDPFHLPILKAKDAYDETMSGGARIPYSELNHESNQSFLNRVNKEIFAKKKQSLEHSKSQQSAPKTETPVSSPKKTNENPVESLKKETKDQTRSDDPKFAEMKASKPKDTPSFQGAMKAGKERKAANKGLLEGMAESAKKFPGPKDEKKQMAAMDMTSKMAKAGKATLDAQEKNVKGKAAKVDPLAAQMSASAKSFTGPTASQKVIAGMSEAGQQAKDKKQSKMSAFGKGVAAKVKAASAAGREKHDQKPGLNPMDYKGASMAKHLKHAFSNKSAIGKAVSKAAGKVSGGFKKVAAPIGKGIKSSAGGVAKGAKNFGSAVKQAATSPTSKKIAGGALGVGQAAAVHLGMAAMHGVDYPQRMHEYAMRGPREFKPGWHGFTTPVERTEPTDATDTRSERA